MSATRSSPAAAPFSAPAPNCAVTSPRRRAGPTGIQRFEPVILHVHRTADPEVVVTEYRYEGSADGRPVLITNILVTRVRDGVIVESRDYADHIAAARAFGRLPALAATLTAEEG